MSTTQKSSFVIDRISLREDAHVDVHVRYDGGSEVFTFPVSYPKNTMLAQVRLAIKERMIHSDAKARLASLVGKHDL